MNIAIIGGGFSGLLAAYLLKKKGHYVVIYEREDHLGGHCKTFTRGGEHWELGTFCSLSPSIKELLIDLDIEYDERFIYKHFVDNQLNRTEHMSREEVARLLMEVEVVREVFLRYSQSLKACQFSHVHEDLLIPFKQFIKERNLLTFGNFIKPFLSSFGLGHIDSIQTYYIFKIFNPDLINSYLQGMRSLFFKEGTQQFIDKLGDRISDVRYCQEVLKIENNEEGVKVQTALDSHSYDKVFISTKLPPSAFKESHIKDFMKKIETNSFISCAYDVSDCQSVTTYFKGHEGVEGKVQFFRVVHLQKKKILIAYGFGKECSNIISGITRDLKKMGLTVNHLIAWKQWQMFPHFKGNNLTSDIYADWKADTSQRNIHLIGSLVSVPTLENLYESVKESINTIGNI